MNKIQMNRVESLKKSLESHKAELAVCMFEYQAKRLRDAIASIERALAKICPMCQEQTTEDNPMVAKYYTGGGVCESCYEPTPYYGFED